MREALDETLLNPDSQKEEELLESDVMLSFISFLDCMFSHFNYLLGYSTFLCFYFTLSFECHVFVFIIIITIGMKYFLFTIIFPPFQLAYPTSGTIISVLPHLLLIEMHA